MTATLDAPARVGGSGGGLPARRALTRWAWRLFRREWRQQLLVLMLLVLAVAATTVGVGLASNLASSDAATFGTANRIVTLPGNDPNLAADLAAATASFGAVEVVAHQAIAVPGSVTPIDARAQDPNGVYTHGLLRLDRGHYPEGAGQVAVTDGVAAIFGLHVGDVWPGAGHDRTVVGIVENPLKLSDEFALLAPGSATPAVHVAFLIRSSSQRVGAFVYPNGSEVEVRPSDQTTNATVAVLVLATLGLLFVGLVAVAGFTVMAGRRLRALGMLGALGATDRHVRLVMLANGAVVGATAALVGTGVGLLSWLAVAPHLEHIAEHRIDRFHLGWWAIAATMLLATSTALAAAWWPARATARIPVVAALSARPTKPRPTHRFAAAGVVVLVGGLVLLTLSHRKTPLLIVGGIVAATLGLLLLSPLGIRALAAAGRGSPIAVRLALRDLARYQARSGAALAAVSLAVSICATIVIAAGASQTADAVTLNGGNLPANQLVVSISADGGGFGPVPLLAAPQLAQLQKQVADLGTTLHASSVVALDAAVNPSFPPIAGLDGHSAGLEPAAMGKPTPGPNGGTSFSSATSVALLVATPELLAHYGIKVDSVEPDTDILTSRTDLTGYELIPGRNSTWHPTVQTVALPTNRLAPTTLLTSHALTALGLQARPAGWLIDTPAPLTNAQIAIARQRAVAAGVSIETAPHPASLAQLRTDATVAGIVLALGVLAMTVGLIRAETAADLRTLTATGASSSVRRTLTGATAGALALLGVLLGTVGAYLAMIAWYRDELHVLNPVPIANLLVLVVGLPAAAAIAGWLFAGREPATLGRRPLE